MAITLYQQKKIPERDQRMWTLFENCVKTKDIAKTFNVSRQTVYDAFARLGKYPFKDNETKTYQQTSKDLAIDGHRKVS